MFCIVIITLKLSSLHGLHLVISRHPYFTYIKGLVLEILSGVNLACHFFSSHLLFELPLLWSDKFLKVPPCSFLLLFLFFEIKMTFDSYETLDFES
jgi:hypothetical protein